MYLEFYGFKKNPFHPSRDAAFYYPSRSHREALAELESGLSKRGGIFLVTGPGGTGKSSLLEELARRCKKKEGVTPIIFTNPLIGFSKLVHTIHERLFPDKTPAASMEALLHQLSDELTSHRTKGWNVQLYIDEAQHLPTDTLAQIGRLLKIRNGAGGVLQVVLVGQSELEQRFESKRLDHLSELISLRCKITQLEEDETKTYIEHRVRIAAAGNKEFVFPFTQQVVNEIAHRADGRPASINRICHQALVAGAQYHELPIDMPTASLVLPTLEAAPKPPKKWLPSLIAAAVATLAVLSGLSLAPRIRDSQANAEIIPATASSDKPDSTLPLPGIAGTGLAEQGSPQPASYDRNGDRSDTKELVGYTNLQDTAPEESNDGEQDGREQGDREQGDREHLEERVDSWVSALNDLENEPRAVTWVSEDIPTLPPTASTTRGNSRDDETGLPRNVTRPQSPTKQQFEPRQQAAGERIPAGQEQNPQPIAQPSGRKTDLAPPENPYTGVDFEQGEMATLSIAAYPIAEIFVDTQPMGQTPLLSIRVPIGRRFVEAVVDGRRQTRVEVLRRGESRSITFRFDQDDQP